jgi:hypothetical protein
MEDGKLDIAMMILRQSLIAAHWARFMDAIKEIIAVDLGPSQQAFRLIVENVLSPPPTTTFMTDG